MATKKLTVGGYTESRCSRCKDITNHIIVAMVDGEVIKVQCCACGSMHKHRPPRVAKSSSAPTVVKRSGGRVSPVRKATTGTTSAPAKRTSRKKSQPAHPAVNQEAVRKLWERALMARSHGDPKPYTIDTVFELDDVVEHSKFGTGYVSELIDNDKVKIMFQCGEKMLRCGLRNVA